MLSIARRAALTAVLVLIAAVAGAPAARANAASEAYVQENATRALATLSEPGLTVAQRQERFGALMERFADMPDIANFVVGRYSGKLREDPALRRDWNAAFKRYAIAVYQATLDQYRGRAVRVTGSQDTIVNGRPRSDVNTEVDIPGRPPFRATWRLEQRDGGYRVIDVRVRLEGGNVWLAQQQRRDFEAALDANGGDIRALIATVNSQTATLQARARGA